MSTFLYYTRAVNPTMLTALGSIATQQANLTEHTMQKVKLFLYYADTHSNALIVYRASNTVLSGHSDASYLSKTKARNRADGELLRV